MRDSTAIRRILVTAAALVAVGALSFGATGCTSATSASPTAVSQAAPAASAPAAAQAAAPVVAATAQAAPAAAGPTAADGRRVVQSSCIGQCHQAGLLKKRYAASSAQAIAADMGSKAGLNSSQQAAVVAYFAQ